MSGSRMKRGNLRAGVLLVALLAIAAAFAWWIVERANSDMRAAQREQAETVARSISIAQIKALTGSKQDIDCREYKRITEQLASICSVNSNWRWIYLMGRKSDGSVFFYLDSEPPASKDHSRPGQLYREAPKSFRSLFDGGTTTVEGPYTDRWGTWISALVPITDTQSGAVIAVLGIDIDARAWKWDLASTVALPIVLVLVLIIVVIAAVFTVRSLDSEPKPILRRLLPPLAVILALLIVGSGAILWQQHQKGLVGTIRSEILAMSSRLNVALGQQAAGLATATQPIAVNSGVKKALREGHADNLLALWRPVFDAMLRDNHVTHFYFMDTNRVCLLRVHQPERRGDRIDRFTAIEAERTRRTASGIELGLLGTFTLRVVEPVFDDTAIVGYVELGKEIEDILPTLQTVAGSHLAVVIRKEFLNRKAWEEGMRMLGRNDEWNRMPHSVVSYASQGRLPEAFTSWADQADHVHGETDREIEFSKRVWRVSATPLLDASGKDVGDLLIMLDITASKAAFARLLTLGGAACTVLLVLLLSFVYVLLRRTDNGISVQQEELRRSEESYRSQFAGNSAKMLLIDPSDASIIDANAAAVEFYGYPRERLLAMKITDINNLSAPDVMSVMASLSKQLGKQFEFRHRLADGSLRDVEVSLSQLKFGERIVLHEIIHDITERKTVEQALIVERRRLAGIIRGTNAGTWEWNIQTGEIIFNERWAGIAGRTLNDMFPVSIDTWRKLTHPDDLKGGDELLERHFRGDLEYYEYESRIKHKDGSWVWVIDRGKVIAWGDDRKPLMMLGTRQDITERKMAAELEKELRERLDRAARMESLGVLVGGVAHDLNNILGPIVALPDMVSEYIARNGNAEDREHGNAIKAMQAIKASGQRAAAVVNDLVVMGRRGQFQKAPVNMNLVVDQALNTRELQSLLAKRPQVTVIRQLSTEQLWSLGSEVRLLRVIVNLVGNAIESIAGRGDVTIRTARKVFTEPYAGFEIVPAGDYALIEIRDTGCGIDAKTFVRMFEPFFSTKTPSERSGSGLGLSVVSGLIKDHAGFLDVKSVEGEGTSFVVFLSAMAAANVPAELRNTPLPTGHERILVVDDDPGQQTLSLLQLNKLGYITTVVSGGEEAVALFEAASKAVKPAPFDLVMADMIMKGIDGLATCRKIISLYPKQKMIIASGHALDEHAKQTNEMGIDWLAKPYTTADLARSVRSRLDR